MLGKFLSNTDIIPLEIVEKAIVQNTSKQFIEKNLDALRKGKNENEVLQDISDRLDRLEKLIKLTFNGHVLIDGQFKKITV